MNRPARFTVADLRRATKAAEAAGPQWTIDIRPDGTISLVRRQDAPITAAGAVEPKREIVLW